MKQIKKYASSSSDIVNQDDQDDQDEEKMIRNELMNISNKLKEKKVPKLADLKAEIQQVTLPFWEKIVLLWSAPISKFWINLTFYIIYLSLFALAVLWPSCGNLYVDTVLWFW